MAVTVACSSPGRGFYCFSISPGLVQVKWHSNFNQSFVQYIPDLILDLLQDFHLYVLQDHTQQKYFFNLNFNFSSLLYQFTPPFDYKTSWTLMMITSCLQPQLLYFAAEVSEGGGTVEFNVSPVHVSATVLGLLPEHYCGPHLQREDLNESLYLVENVNFGIMGFSMTLINSYHGQRSHLIEGP